MGTETKVNQPPRRFLIATAVADLKLAPSWNRLGLNDARKHVIELFTNKFGYTLVDTLEMNPTADQLRNALRDFCSSPDRRESDILAVYFTGHGERLPHTDEHVLYTADTDPANNFHSIVTASIARAILYETPVRRLLLMLDTCYSGKGGADFTSAALDNFTHHWEEVTGNEIVVITSAQPGQFAEAGRFPRLFADAVESVAAESDGSPTLAVKDIVATINDLAPKPMWQIVGVNIVRSTGKSPEFLPNPVDPHLRVKHTRVCDPAHPRMTPPHATRAVAALDALRALPDGINVRGALEEVLHEQDTSTWDITALVAQVFRTGRSVRLFELLTARIPPPVQHFLLLDLRDSWLRLQTASTIEALFQTVSTSQVRDAYFRAGGEPAENDPADLGEALDHLGKFGVGLDGFTPLHRFVAALEILTETAIPDDLFELAHNRMAALRGDARSQLEKPTRLVIEIPDDAAVAGARKDPRSGHGFTWPARIEYHRYAPAESAGWGPAREVACDPSPEGVAEAVNTLVSKVGQKCVLGFIVPRAVFDAVPEAWLYSTEVDEPAPHWLCRPTILHCTERRLPSLNDNWRDKLTSIRHRVQNHHPDVQWIPTSTPRQIQILVRDSNATCFGMDFVPSAIGDKLSEDPLMAAIKAGAPFIVWTAHPNGEWDDAKTELVKTLLKGPFDEMPNRLHSWRENRADSAAEHVRLIWDDPEILPPTMQLIGVIGKACPA
ncbi:caspase family protein [Nocardia takedensis]|uniref:VMAP-C domain-containing protein n=1 Tax=Nocardia takedensis TaxID=259390 RepID=UPI003F76CC10